MSQTIPSVRTFSFREWCLLMAIMLLCAGCSAPWGASSEASSTEQADVKKRIAEIFRAAETKDLSRLDSYHWYGPHFTKFASGSGKRLEAASAREGEHKGLNAIIALKLRLEELQVDIFNGAAVATFITTATFHSGAETVTKRERGTLVLAKHRGSWKIVHEHFSAAE